MGEYKWKLNKVPFVHLKEKHFMNISTTLFLCFTSIKQFKSNWTQFLFEMMVPLITTVKKKSSAQSSSTAIHMMRTWSQFCCWKLQHLHNTTNICFQSLDETDKEQSHHVCSVFKRTAHSNEKFLVRTLRQNNVWL